MNNIKMINFRKIAIASLLFLISISAQAFIVQYSDPGPNTNAIAIWNLDIGGTAYDITVVESAADTAELCPGASGGSGGVPL